MKPSLRLLAVAGTVAALAAFAALPASAADLPKTKVNVIGTWANLSIYKEREFPFWTKTIPEKSNGAVTAEIRAFTEWG